jgi:hypothetical protein
MFTIRNLILTILCIPFTSCYKRYIGTRDICGNKLYAELYEINPAGVDAWYLTDSTNFRFYVGRFDPESGNYKFECNGNLVFIERFIHRDQYISDTVNIIKEKKVINLDDLRKQHKFE